ncbi:hypothetical protein ABKN59_005400 [Abortiporus biennis]
MGGEGQKKLFDTDKSRSEEGKPLTSDGFLEDGENTIVRDHQRKELEDKNYDVQEKSDKDWYAEYRSEVKEKSESEECVNKELEDKPDIELE